MKFILRLILLPIGLFKNLLEFANDGSRDIQNKFRFKKSYIDKGCFLNANTILHPKSSIYRNSIVNNSEIHSYTYIGNNCLIQNAVIGRFCSISNDVLIGLGIHPLDLNSTSPVFYRIHNPLKFRYVKGDLYDIEYKLIEIGNDVWIGARAIIMGGVKIGHGSVIAANSVVTKNVPPYAVVAGVPAKIIKYRFGEVKVKEMLEEQWWLKDL